MSATFVEQHLAGAATEGDIDSFVARWHDGAGGDSLPEFLGLSEDEYALWVERPEFLGAILAARRGRFDLNAVVCHPEAAPAAVEALGRDRVDDIRDWFRRTSRIGA